MARDECGDRPDAPSILLVEDDALVLLDIEMIVRDAGYRYVCTAASAMAALRVLESQPVSLAIVDYDLAGGNTQNLLRRLLLAGTRVVILTGFGDDLVLPDDLRAIPVVAKPFAETAITSLLPNAQE